MAYVVYIACDKCGTDMGGWVDTPVGIGFAKKYARKQGWQVGKTGWFCPTCKRQIKKDRVPSEQAGDEIGV